MPGGNAINLLVAFYDIHGRKGEVLFFYFVPDTTRDKVQNKCGSLYYLVIVIFPLVLGEGHGPLHHVDAHVGRRVGAVLLVQRARVLLPATTP
jgi:hypothetical protein